MKSANISDLLCMSMQHIPMEYHIIGCDSSFHKADTETDYWLFLWLGYRLPNPNVTKILHKHFNILHHKLVNASPQKKACFCFKLR